LRRNLRRPSRYAAYGVVLLSRLPLPLLPARPGSRTDIHFEVLPAGVAADPDSDLEVLVSGRRRKPLVSWGKDGRGVLLRYAGLADFRATAGLRRVSCLPAPGVRRGDLAALFADAVLPLLLAWRGEFVLHASAVRAPGGAVAFLGPGGSGKSTLAAALGRAGLPVLADDALLLRFPRGRPVAYPGPPAVRLDGRSFRMIRGRRPPPGGGKSRVPLRGRARPGDAEAVPLLRIYLLRRGATGGGKGGERLRLVSWRKALMALVDSQFLLDRGRPSAIRSGFLWSELIARKGLVYEARLPVKD